MTQRYSKSAAMGVEMSAGDLLIMHKLKNTEGTSNLHINQRNIPSAAQISVVVNKEIKKPQYFEKNRRLKNKRLQKVLMELVLCDSYS